MIGKVIRGWDARHLVGYLLGRGESNEHTRPSVIASWQNDPGALQPARVGADDFAYAPGEVSKLCDHVNAVAAAAGLPRRQPAEGEPGYTKHGYVWHLPVSIPAEDGLLSHQIWGKIAADVMDRTGIAPADDPGGCRWIAVHHGQNVDGNDHMHIVAVLVRQDTGRRFHPANDFRAVRRVAREWEDKLGLTVTAESDTSAERVSTRGETEKAARRHERGVAVDPARTDPAETTRGQLRQAVADTAATVGSPDEFVAGLRERGLLVHLRRNDAGAISGYAVADPTYTTNRGTPVFFGGGSLAKDLTWPKVTAELDRHGGPLPERPTGPVTWDLTAAALRNAAGAVVAAHHELRVTGDEQVRADIAVAGQRLLTTYSRVTEGAHPEPGRPRTAASWHGQRCARAARFATRPASAGGRAADAADAMNTAARELMKFRMIAERGPSRAAGLELAVALAGLMLEIAAWHEHRHQHRAAQAARSASGGISHGTPGPTAPRATPATTPTATATDERVDRTSGQRPYRPDPHNRPPKGPTR